jgi:hypothetical protein
MGSINPSAEGRAGYRSAPSTHGYLVYAGRGKRSVLSRVPTHFRPESPPSSRKTFYFQYGGCPGHAQICLLTANSGLETIVEGIYASREGGLVYPLLNYVKLLLLLQQ